MHPDLFFGRHLHPQRVYHAVVNGFPFRGLAWLAILHASGNHVTPQLDVGIEKSLDVLYVSKQLLPVGLALLGIATRFATIALGLIRLLDFPRIEWLGIGVVVGIAVGL